MSFLIKGLIIGFSIAAPVGPIGILCIKRSLINGRAHGLLSGLGAATADTLYGCVAGFGLTFLSGFLVSQKLYLSIIGGLFLSFLGVRSFFQPVAENDSLSEKQSLIGAYSSTFLLTLTNPMTILSFTAVFAGLGLANTGGDYETALILVLGVFLGSATWWTLLSTGVSLFRDRFKPRAMRWVNRISGFILFVFGIIALLSNVITQVR